MADISLYLTNVNVSIGRNMDVGQVGEQLSQILAVCLLNVANDAAELDACSLLSLVMSECTVQISHCEWAGFYCFR